MNIKSVIGIVIIPFIALSVVTLLYILLPVSSNLLIFIKHSSSTNISLLTTIFGIFYAIGLIIWGGLSDKIGKENTLVIGLLLLACISFIMPFIVDYYLLLITRAIQGFCAASFPPVAIAWISINLRDSLKSKAISILSCAFLLAGTIGQWFGVIMIHHSLYNIMWPLACVYVLGSLLFYSYRVKNNHLNHGRSIISSNISTSTIFRQLPCVLLNKKLFPIYICAFFVLLSFVSLYSILTHSVVAPYMTTLRNIGIVTVLLSLTASYMFTLIKPKEVLIIALALMAISLFIHYFYITHQLNNLVLLYICHFGFIAGIAYAVPSMITYVSIQSIVNERGIATSLYTCILFVGASLGAFLPSIMNTQFLIIGVVIALLFCAINLIAIEKRPL